MLNRYGVLHRNRIQFSNVRKSLFLDHEAVVFPAKNPFSRRSFLHLSFILVSVSEIDDTEDRSTPSLDLPVARA